MTEMTFAQDAPVLVAFDIGKARHEVFIAVPAKKCRQLHPAILGLQLVKRGRAETVLAANLRRGHASFLLFDHSDDLVRGLRGPTGATVPLTGETALPHVVCSFKGWADSTSDRGTTGGRSQSAHRILEKYLA